MGCGSSTQQPLGEAHPIAVVSDTRLEQRETTKKYAQTEKAPEPDNISRRDTPLASNADLTVDESAEAVKKPRFLLSSCLPSGGLYCCLVVLTRAV